MFLCLKFLVKKALLNLTNIYVSEDLSERRATLTLSQMGGDFRFPPLLNRCPLFLRQRETKQLETFQHFDKALIGSCFDTIKKFLGVLEKKWGHAK